MKEGTKKDVVGDEDSSKYTYKEMRFLFKRSPITKLKQFPLSMVNIILLLADKLMDVNESELFLYSYPKRYFYNLLYNVIEQRSQLALNDPEQLQALIEDVGRILQDGNAKLDPSFNLNLLWASLVRRVFNVGEFLNPFGVQHDLRLLICFDNLIYGFQSILKDYLENEGKECNKEKESENTKENSQSKYDFGGIQANKLQSVLISFIGQLCQCGFVDTAQAIHNYLYLTGKVARDGTALNDQKALARVLGSLFHKKLNLKGRILTSSIVEKSNYPWKIHTQAELCELSFLKAVYRAAVKEDVFCQPFHADNYVDKYQASFADDVQEKLDFLLPTPLQLTVGSLSSKLSRNTVRSNTTKSLLAVFDIQGGLCLSFFIRGLQQSFPKDISFQDAPSKHDFDGIDKKMIQRAMTLFIAQLIKCGNLKAAQDIHEILQKKHNNINKLAIRLFHHALNLQGCILAEKQKKKSDKKHKRSAAEQYELGFFKAVCKVLLDMPEFQHDFKIEDYEEHYQYSFDVDLQLFLKKFKSHAPVKLTLEVEQTQHESEEQMRKLTNVFKKMGRASSWSGNRISAAFLTKFTYSQRVLPRGSKSFELIESEDKQNTFHPGRKLN